MDSQSLLARSADRRALLCAGGHLGASLFGLAAAHMVGWPAVGFAATTAGLWLKPGAANSPWNRPIRSAAQYSTSSDARVRSLMRNGSYFYMNSERWSHPVYKASAGDPLITVQHRRAKTAIKIFAPTSAAPSPGADSVANIVQPDGITVWQLWKSSISGRNQWTAELVRSARLDGTLVANAQKVQLGTIAYGGVNIAGVIRAWEVEGDNEINHALSMAIRWEQLKSGPVWPASTEDASGKKKYTGSIPMGTLFAIPPAINVGALGLSAGGKKVAMAAQRYGIYVTNQGGGPVLYGDQTIRPTIATQIRIDLRRFKSYLRVVTNNTP